MGLDEQFILEAPGFFSIRINSVLPDVPISFDVYLVVNQKPTVFRRSGEMITSDRMEKLLRLGARAFCVPLDQRSIYIQTLKVAIKDPDLGTEQKSKALKECAFVHVHDLFTKQDVGPIVTEAKSLVEEMVSFVSTDVDAIVSLLSLSTHDYYTYNHCVDVAVYSIALAKKFFGEDSKLLMLAGLGGLLHDIGKRKIDYNLINKNGKLTPEEWEEIKKHPQYGKEYLESLAVIPDEARRVVYEHHENFDGTGYPNKVEGEKISKLARIVTIADVFDALTTDRSYHKACPPHQALEKMYSMQPGKFDPGIFRSFDKHFSSRKPDVKLTSDFDPCQPGSVARLFTKKAA